MRRVVLHARIQPGHTGAVREILQDGPPFELEKTSLERHLVFLAEDWIVFLFVGVHADEEIERVLTDSEVLGTAGRLSEHLVDGPRFAEEVFAWERVADTDGVDFRPQPGPGDSD